MTKPNIHTHTVAICKKLGLDPNFVAWLNISPRTVVASVYLRDENGSKYVVPYRSDVNDEDWETKTEVAKELRVFEVTA